MTRSEDVSVESLIPATVHMISGCRDSQTSADVSNVSSFELPDPAGRAGGACTSALLNVLYKNKRVPRTTRGYTNFTWVDVLNGMRSKLKSKGYRQTPQLTSSRLIDVKETFSIVPPDCTGTKRAVLVGINYYGQKGQLSGCHNDVKNMKEYLVDVLGFSERNITVLMDDGYHQSPTRSNILNAFSTLSSITQAGDAAYVHYSGHGAYVRDDSGDEDDGYDETLVPVDYKTNGQIRDDTLFKKLVAKMPEGSTLTCLMDCCHSGTVLDLPYQYKAGQSGGMSWNPQFDYDKMKKFAIAAGIIIAFLGASAAASDGNCFGCGCFDSAVGCFEDSTELLPSMKLIH